MAFSLEDQLHGALRRYIGAPQWVKSSVGEVYRLLPVALLRGPAYRKYKRLLARDMDAARLETYANDRLAETLRWAVETVPAYAHLRSAVTDIVDPRLALAHFPFTTKAGIKAGLDAHVSAAVAKAHRLSTFTGGSTAEPMHFYLEKGITRAREYAFMEEFQARVGCRVGDLALALRGRTVPAAAQPDGRLWMHEPIKQELMFSSDHLQARWMPQYVAALKKWRPRFIRAFPSSLYPLARWLAEHPAPEVTGRVRGVMLYSENVYDFQLRLFRKVFDCPVIKHYGHSERVLMAASMPADDRYFFWPQYGYFELVDAGGKAITEPGIMGEIVGTSFDNRVMPFIRYRTGDLGMLGASPAHPDLPGYPCVERIEGRLQEFLVGRDGRLISISSMGAAHFELLASVDEIQYEQHQPGHFQLKVVSRSQLTEGMAAAIQQAVAAKTQGACSCSVQRVDRIKKTRHGKQAMLVQHLDLSSYHIS